MTRKKIITTGILAIIPFVYLFAGFHFNHLIGLFSLRDIDPEYAYFISGLNIANGHFVLGHIDHPGSPLQYLIAITFRLAYFLSPQNHPFNEDVFLNSDYYLNLANHVALIIVVLCLFLIGKKVYEKTQNFAYALLIQTAPFFSEITYDIIGRLGPETLMPIPVLLFSLFFLNSAFSENKEFSTKDIVLLALISGFGLSIKLNFITMWIIPLFILHGFRKKIYFTLLSLIAFFLIAFPVTLKINVFYSWVKNLIVHTGEYGQGDASFIDWNTFIANVKTIWESDHSLFYLLILLIVVSSVFVLRKKTKSDRLLFRISAGIVVAIILQILLVSKHYSYRYLIPSLAFLPMLVILSLEMISRMYPTKWNKQAILLVALLGFIPGVKKQLASAQLRTLALENEMNGKLETWHHAQILDKNSYKIIVSQGYGAPFQDYAIMYSSCWAGPHYADYAQTWAKLYPDTYQYFTWDNTVKYFGPEFNPDTIIKSQKPVYLYLENDTPELMKKTMDKLFLPGDSVNISANKIYINENTGESIYSLQLTSLKKHLVIP